MQVDIKKFNNLLKKSFHLVSGELVSTCMCVSLLCVCSLSLRLFAFVVRFVYICMEVAQEQASASRTQDRLQ